MARYDHHFSDDGSGTAESRAHIDVLIRPGLRRAFPLPAAEQAGDERFRLLLEALAQRRGEPGPPIQAETTSTR